MFLSVEPLVTPRREMGNNERPNPERPRQEMPWSALTMRVEISHNRLCSETPCLYVTARRQGQPRHINDLVAAFQQAGADDVTHRIGKQDNKEYQNTSGDRWSRSF